MTGDCASNFSKCSRLTPNIQCPGVFGSAEEGLKGNSAAETRTSCSWTSNCRECLASNALPELQGSLLPSVNIIMVTVYRRFECGRIFKALQAGGERFTDLFIKSRLSEDLLQAIRDVFKGGAPMSIHIARKVVNYFHSLGPLRAADKDLSAREDQVLKLLASGYIYKEIGEKLDIGVETVRSHVKNICEKMHVRGRIEAVAKRRLDAGF